MEWFSTYGGLIGPTVILIVGFLVRVWGRVMVKTSEDHEEAEKWSLLRPLGGLLLIIGVLAFAYRSWQIFWPA